MKTKSTKDETSRERLRVLVVAPSFDILGGQSVQAARLVSRLREVSSIDVDFLPINPRLPGALRELQAVKYLRTVVTSILYIATLFVRVPKADVLHVFSASYFSFIIAPTPAILIGKLFRKRVLLNYHSGEAEDHLTRWPSAFTILRLVDAVAVPSKYLVGIFSKFGIAAQAINNLIELDEFAYRKRESLRPVFLCNRNFETHYGVDVVLRAFALIETSIPEAQLIVAGHGSQRANLEAIAAKLALRNVRFIGRVEPGKIAETYQAADIYLNGSDIDNQPLSILEAFACGLPVITTDAGGIPTIVVDGKTGFLVKRRDHKAMAERAFELLSDSAKAQTVAEAAHAECEKYSWRSVRQRWLKLYADLAGSGASSQRKLSRIQKLQQMSLDELRERASQALAIFAERRGLSSLTRLPADAAWMNQFRNRKSLFFPSLEDRVASVNEFRKRWPAAEKQITAEADRIADGRFDLLGLKNLSFGEPIDWHFEPVAGKKLPRVHWSRIDYLNPESAGDKKIVWELNRHQHFVKLGQAYWLTQDEKYATAFVSQLESWMDANPPKVGINWASSLEVALRSIAWLWALHFFSDSPSLTSGIVTRALTFLYLNARHLETYLSTYFSPNTHLTGEALGLFYLGTLVPEFREAERWRNKGRQILLDQLPQHVRPDGVYFEQSSYYHRYTTDFYTHFLLLSQGNGQQLDTPVKGKLQFLLEHLMFITRPDGTTPLFGDDDGGRLIKLDRSEPNDFRAALSTGAALFNRGDFKFVAGDLAEETFWLLGPRGAALFDRIPPEEPAVQSRAFADGGYYVMRDSWKPTANYLLFDCGPHGAENCGHAHADALSFELAVNSRTLLVDPGAHTYTGSKDWRDWFRSSQAHNVLLVDGEPSSVPAGPFSWESVAQCETEKWITERRFDYVSGNHDGYQRLPFPASHSRSVLFLKKDYWLIRDRVKSEGEHQLQLRFHFASHAKAQPDSENASFSSSVPTGQTAALQMFAFGSEGSWSREDGWVSHCYGEREVAPVGVFSASSKGAGDLTTFLLPSSKEDEKFKVKELEAIGGCAFEIENGSYSDVVLLRGPDSGRVETVRLASDFEWTWARFSRTNSELPDELLVIEGQSLMLDGKEILNSTKTIDYLVASRAGSKFRLETSEGRFDFTFPIEDLEVLFSSHQQQAQV